MEDYFGAHPPFAVHAGRHEFDGKLPDWSRDGLEKEVERLGANRKRALQFDPAELGARQRFERDYVIAVIDRDLFWLKSARWPYKNPMGAALLERRSLRSSSLLQGIARGMITREFSGLMKFPVRLEVAT